ncbi:MAG: TatD family hydrolase [Erysipelotrichaceae bacterium]|jgi:TatD DNase family protein|nr:TatD family hydrolase [Erysipelotrichaceae bacterium]
MKLFDTHCHLNDELLYKNLDAVIERALKVGVDKMVVIGWDKESSLSAINIAQRFPFVYATVGVHPNNIDGVDIAQLNQVFALAKQNKVVAIGEIGLDYHYTKDEENHARQKEIFIKQIEFANEVGLPIVIHSRDAFLDTICILKQHKPLHGGVMHCYSGSVESLKDVLDLGLFIGVDGPVTFKNAKTPKEVAFEAPLEKLVLETDAPYLSPQAVRGTINEPANLIYIADEIANIRQMSKKHLLEVVYDNACRLYKI